MCCNNNNCSLVCIFISLGTMIQTSVHLVCVLYGYCLYICQISPTIPQSIFLYLTYFYKQECGNIITVDKGFGRNNIYDIQGIVQEILNKSILPEQAPESSRTFKYFLVLMVLDCVWFMAAVALLMGTCCKIKQCFSVIFYAPWLALTALILIVDAAATVHFSLDLPKTINFTSWATFAGIQNPNDLQNLDANNAFISLSMTPTLTVCLLTSRLLIFWILNLLSFIYVLKASVRAYRALDANKRPQQHHTVDSSTTVDYSDANADGMDLDQSAARIRSWQLFYGAIETTSSQSSESSSKPRSDDGAAVDENSNSSRPKRKVEALPGFKRTAAAHGYTEGGGRNEPSLEELRGQLPWSYFQLPRDLVLTQIRHDGGSGDGSRNNSRSSSMSGTEL